MAPITDHYLTFTQFLMGNEFLTGDRYRCKYMYVLSSYIQIMNSSTTRLNHQTQKTQDIQRMFFNHCATLIQAHFRGYLQRKRYRQFLPVYRRVRQLLLAVTEGWRVRKIMKLKSTVRAVRSIKEQESRKEVIHARIAKRQLSDEIGRLKKKGVWMQVLGKEQKAITIHKRQRVASKQNSALYANVKSISIKNVFGGRKETTFRKNNIKQGNIIKEGAQTKRKQTGEESSVELDETKKNPFDEQPIRSNPHTFDEFFNQFPEQHGQVAVKQLSKKNKIKISPKIKDETTPFTRIETQVFQEQSSVVDSIRSDCLGKKKRRLMVTLASPSVNKNTVDTSRQTVEETLKKIDNTNVSMGHTVNFEETYNDYQVKVMDKSRGLISQIKSFGFSKGSIGFKKAYEKLIKGMSDTY